MHRLQFMIPQAREAVPAHFEGADMRAAESYSQQFVFAVEEAKVKPGIMRHEDAVLQESLQGREDFFWRWLSDEHLIGNAVNLRRTKGNSPRHLNQGTVFSHYVTAFQGNRSDLDDPVASPGREAGRFHVQKNVFLLTVD